MLLLPPFPRTLPPPSSRCRTPPVATALTPPTPPVSLRPGSKGKKEDMDKLTQFKLKLDMVVKQVNKI